MWYAHSTYHRVLRVGLVVCAFTLVFESGVLGDTTARLSDTTEQYLANAVGISVGVEPTELNQYTAQLAEQEQELAEREARLEEREIAVGLSTGSERPASSDTTTYILASILFILLILILLNYALDYLRLREQQQTAQPV